MKNKILCKKCEATKTMTDYHIKPQSGKGKCNRCFVKIEDND